MTLKLSILPIKALFDPEGAVPKELLNQNILQDFKEKHLIGTPEACINISSTKDGDDGILWVEKRVDPESALGYSVYAGEDDYFNHLRADLYTPTQDEILGALNE